MDLRVPKWPKTMQRLSKPLVPRFGVRRALREAAPRGRGELLSETLLDLARNGSQVEFAGLRISRAGLPGQDHLGHGMRQEQEILLRRQVLLILTL